MLSFWEKKTFLQYDYIIIGSGIVGLSAAICLKEKAPKKSVLVLERGILPTGASTKNAGFACIGSLTELLDDLKYMSETQMIELVLQRKIGLEKLRQRLGDKAIDYQALGSYELIGDAEFPHLSQLERINELLRPHLQTDAFTLVNEKIADFGFVTKHVKAMISNNCEGQLDPGKMMYALLLYAQQLGIMVINGAKVKHLETEEKGVKITLWHQQIKENIYFQAQQVGICTNAFTKQLLPDIDLNPGRGQVLVTEPIPNLPFKGIFHFEQGYYYFRNYQNRLIFGGGRNLDYETEKSTEFVYNQLILKDLTEKIKTIILPNKEVTIADSWTGIMAFGKDKIPLLKRLDKHTVIGVKLGGMGVAIGSDLGEMIADLLLGE